MYITTGDKMKKIVIPIIFITLIGIIIFNQNKEKEIITQVITYQEDIDKINETCHLRNNKFDLEVLKREGEFKGSTEEYEFDKITMSENDPSNIPSMPEVVDFKVRIYSDKEIESIRKYALRTIKL